MKKNYVNLRTNLGLKIQVRLVYALDQPDLLQVVMILYLQGMHYAVLTHNIIVSFVAKTGIQ